MVISSLVSAICNLNRLSISAYRTGITIGAVVVPQSMAYASLANLPPQFGLYSSFMGVLIYWFFATSKDITIGVSSHTPATKWCLLTDTARGGNVHYCRKRGY